MLFSDDLVETIAVAAELKALARRRLKWVHMLSVYLNHFPETWVMQDNVVEPFYFTFQLLELLLRFVDDKLSFDMRASW